MLEGIDHIESFLSGKCCNNNNNYKKKKKKK